MNVDGNEGREDEAERRPEQPTGLVNEATAEQVITGDPRNLTLRF